MCCSKTTLLRRVNIHFITSENSRGCLTTRQLCVIERRACGLRPQRSYRPVTELTTRQTFTSLYSTHARQCCTNTLKRRRFFHTNMHKIWSPVHIYAFRFISLSWCVNKSVLQCHNTIHLRDVCIYICNMFFLLFAHLQNFEALPVRCHIDI